MCGKGRGLGPEQTPLLTAIRSLQDVTTFRESSMSSVESRVISGGRGGECLGVLQVAVLIEEENDSDRMSRDDDVTWFCGDVT